MVVLSASPGNLGEPGVANSLFDFGCLQTEDVVEREFNITSDVFQGLGPEARPIGDTFGIFSVDLRGGYLGGWQLSIKADVARNPGQGLLKGGFRVTGLGHGGRTGVAGLYEGVEVARQLYVEAEYVGGVYFREDSVAFGLISNGDSRQSRMVELAGEVPSLMAVREVAISESTGTVKPELSLELQGIEHGVAKFEFSIRMLDLSPGVIRAKARIWLDGIDEVLELPFFGVVGAPE